MSNLILVTRLRRKIDHALDVLEFIEASELRVQLREILSSLKSQLIAFSSLLNKKDNPFAVQQIESEWQAIKTSCHTQFQSLTEAALAVLIPSQQSWINLFQNEIKHAFESNVELTLEELREEAKSRLLENQLATFTNINQSELKAPTCFISYAWGNRIYEEWVHRLAYQLKLAGINVTLDIWHNQTGSIPQFTQRVSKAISDYVLVVGTKLLRQKYHHPEKFKDGSWVYEELEQIHNRKKENFANHGIIKIPLEHGQSKEVFPDFLNVLPHDLTNFTLSQHYHEKLFNLLELLYASYPTLIIAVKQLRAVVNTDIKAIETLTEKELSEILQLKDGISYEKTASDKQALIKKLITPVHLPSLDINAFSLWQVPTQGDHFIDRTELLAELHTKLINAEQSTVAIVACHGLGGVGKTQVVLKYVYKHYQKYKNVFWFTAETEQQLLLNYRLLAEELNLAVENESLSKIAEQVKRWFENKINSGWLLVYDNAVDAELIAKYRPRLGGKILLTSRKNAWDKKQSIAVDVFTLDEARAYILEVTGFSLEESQIEIDELAETLSNLPLALAQACAYFTANNINLRDYLTLYEENRAEMLADETMPAEAQHEPVAVTWNITFKAISAQQKDAWPLLVSCSYLQAEDISELLLKAFFNSQIPKASNKAFIDVLGCLQRYSLLKQTARIGERTFSMHRLVQDVIIDSLSEERRQQYLCDGLNILQTLYPYKKHAQVEDFIKQRKLLPHLEKYLQRLEECLIKINKNSTSIEQKIILVKNIELGLLRPLLVLMAYGHENIGDASKNKILLKRILGIEEKYYGLNHLEIAQTLMNLGNAYGDLGNPNKQKEFLERALCIFEAHHGENHSDVADALSNLSNAHGALGNAREQKQLLEKVLTIQKKLFAGENPSVISTLINLANANGELGDVSTKIILLEHALLNLKKFYDSNHPEIAKVLVNLGNAYEALGDPGKSLILLKQALQSFEIQYGNNHLEVARTLHNLANVYFALNQLHDAKCEVERAYQIFLILPGYGLRHPHTQKTRENLERIGKAILNSSSVPSSSLSAATMFFQQSTEIDVLQKQIQVNAEAAKQNPAQIIELSFDDEVNFYSAEEDVLEPSSSDDENSKLVDSPQLAPRSF